MAAKEWVPVNEVGERLDQLLAQPGLQGSQGTELQGQGCYGHQDTRRPWTQAQHTPGPSALTSLMILMRTQLLVEDVMSLKNSGARDR